MDGPKIFSVILIVSVIQSITLPIQTPNAADNHEHNAFSIGPPPIGKYDIAYSTRALPGPSEKYQKMKALLEAMRKSAGAAESKNAKLLISLWEKLKEVKQSPKNQKTRPKTKGTQKVKYQSELNRPDDGTQNGDPEDEGAREEQEGKSGEEAKEKCVEQPKETGAEESKKNAAEQPQEKGEEQSKENTKEVPKEAQAKARTLSKEVTKRSTQVQKERLEKIKKCIDGRLTPTNNAVSVDNGNDIQPSQQSEVNTELVSSEMDVILNSLNQPHISKRFRKLKIKRRKFMKRSLIRLNKILKETPVSPIIGRIIFMLDDTPTSSGGNGNSDTEGTENMEIETRGLIEEMPFAQKAPMSEGPKDPEMSFDADLPPTPVMTTMTV